MATQKAIYLAAPNEPYTIVSDIKRPVPGPKQVLVKSLVTGINPIEPLMQKYGTLVEAWPVILGCEASGVVLEVGSEVTRFKVGDGIFGCSRLGTNEYTTFQETFLMDEALSYKRPPGMSAEEASTVGVALDTAALSIFAGCNIEVPKPGSKVEGKDEWVIIIGASGSVGSVGVQLARLAGYKVLASCSPAKASIPLGYGATATLNHRLDLEDQLAQIKKETGGNFARVFDASAAGYATAIPALEQVSAAKEKWFSSVDDWSPFDTPSSIHEFRTSLGQIGKDSPFGKIIDQHFSAWIPLFEEHLVNGSLRPLQYQLVDGQGLEAVIKASDLFEEGKAERKLAVRIQSD